MAQLVPSLTVAFVIDTSVGMLQRNADGLSLLDQAKALVEYFVKQRRVFRQRMGMAAARPDTYVLATYSTDVDGLPVLFQCDADGVIAQVKALRARDLSRPGRALGAVFEAIHLRRTSLSADSPGKGRKPWLVEATAIVLVTRGGASVHMHRGVREALQIPVSRAPGAAHFREPYRWDTKVFAIVLPPPSQHGDGAGDSGSGAAAVAMAAIDAVDDPASPSNTKSYLRSVCDATGGKCYSANTLRQARHVVDKLMTKLAQFGVMVDLRQDTRGAATAAPTLLCRARMLFLRCDPGQWVLPEPFFPNPSLTALPRRTARPTLHVMPSLASLHDARDTAYAVRTLGFPIDVYDVQRCALTDALYKATTSASGSHVPCWPVCIAGSGGKRPAAPCGFMAMSHEPTVKHALSQTGTIPGPATTCALVLLPYDYPTLFRLLHKLGKAAGATSAAHAKSHMLQAITRDRSVAFAAYVKTLPTYYHGTLRNVLQSYDLHNLVPHLHRDAVGYTRALRGALKRLPAQAAAELDALKLQAAHGAQREAGGGEGASDVGTTEARTVHPWAARSAPPSAAEWEEGGSWQGGSDGLARLAALGASATVNQVALDVALPSSMSRAMTALQATKQRARPRRGSVDGGDDEWETASVASTMTAASAYSWRADYDAEGPGGKHRVPLSLMGNFSQTLARRETLRDPYTEDGLPPPSRAPVFGSPYATRTSRFKARSSRGMPLVDEAVVGSDASTSDSDSDTGRGDLPMSSLADSGGDAASLDSDDAGDDSKARPGRDVTPSTPRTRGKRPRSDDLQAWNDSIWRHAVRAIRTSTAQRGAICCLALKRLRGSRGEVGTYRRMLVALCRNAGDHRIAALLERNTR